MVFCEFISRHHELAEQLHLLHLGERDFVADLNRLQVSNRSLILKLKTGEVGLLGPEVLGLGLRGGERAVERIQRRVNVRLRALDSGSRGDLVAGIELLELRRETVEGIGEPFLLADQAAEIIEQVFVGLPKAGATARSIFDDVPELLGQVGDGGGFLPKLLQLAGKH